MSLIIRTNENGSMSLLDNWTLNNRPLAPEYWCCKAGKVRLKENLFISSYEKFEIQDQSWTGVDWPAKDRKRKLTSINCKSLAVTWSEDQLMAIMDSCRQEPKWSSWTHADDIQKSLNIFGFLMTQKLELCCRHCTTMILNFRLYLKFNQMALVTWG